MWSKRTITAVSVAGLAAAGLVGATVAAVADDGDGAQSRLESLVQDGTLTQQEADSAQKAYDALEQQREQQMQQRQQDWQATIDAVAEAAGVSSDDLQQRWQDGESLADIAGDNAAAVEQVLTEQMQQRVAEMEAAIPDRVSALMEATGGHGPGMGFEGHHGRGAGFGPGQGMGLGSGGPDDAGMGMGLGLGGPAV
jgi:FtsZ-binding cell division protein ZapB